MSSGVVRSAISSVLDDSVFSINSENAKATKTLATSLLDAVIGDDWRMDRFDAFSSTLLKKIQAASSVALDKRKSYSCSRERAWATFHSLRVGELPGLWSSLFDDMDLHARGCSALLTEHVNEKIFTDSMLKNRSSAAQTATITNTHLTDDEGNALRYVAGYVPFSLQKKLRHRPEFTHCLACMAVEGSVNEGTTDSYLHYTKDWIARVNRGGLFKVNDQTYKLFVSLEMKVRQHLAFLFHAETTSKQTVIDDIMQDEDVLFNWAITADIDDDSLSHELLSHIVNLWLTIRGFSAAGAWMEHYKQCKEVRIKGGLRKGLKRRHASGHDDMLT